MKREMHLGDPCVFCDQGWDKIEVGPCPGRPGLDEQADAQMTANALMDRLLSSHDEKEALGAEIDALRAENERLRRACLQVREWGIELASLQPAEREQRFIVLWPRINQTLRSAVRPDECTQEKQTDSKEWLRVHYHGDLYEPWH